MAYIIIIAVSILACWGSYSRGFSRGLDDGFEAGKEAVHRKIERVVAAKRAAAS